MAARTPFMRSVTRWINVSKRQFVAVHREVVVRGLRYASEDTPVDTGRARASWRVSVGKPDLSYDPRPLRGAADFAAQSQRGEAIRARQAIKAQRVKPGKDVWITNNVPYALLLEDGHSKQNDRMLRRTYGRLRAELDGIVAYVKSRVRK